MQCCCFTRHIFDIKNFVSVFRFQLDEVRDRVKNRKENSFTAFNYWTSLAEDLRSQIRLSEAKLETMRLQMDSLRNSQMGVQKVSKT